MRVFVLAMVACVMSVGVASACDDHDGECEIEDWRPVDMFGSLQIEGVATCDSGLISIRLYDEASGESKYLGNAAGFIQGHTFSAIATDISEPESLMIRYSIDPSY